MLETFKTIFEFLAQNAVVIIGALLGLVAALEVITSLTPTEKDDLFVQRIGNFIRKIAGLLKIPNRKEGGGTHPPAA